MIFVKFNRGYEYSPNTSLPGIHLDWEHLGSQRHNSSPLSMRFNRNDYSLVRITIPLGNSKYIREIKSVSRLKIKTKEYANLRFKLHDLELLREGVEFMINIHHTHWLICDLSRLQVDFLQTIINIKNITFRITKFYRAYKLLFT